MSSETHCRATDYGSSFSRGMVLKTESYGRIYLSGTASIKEEGKSVFIDDPQGQIIQTMKVVNDLLEENYFRSDDICWGIIYVKDDF